MKFAHLADTHLGYRQYGLIEREKDFYEVFERVIDKIIEENVDFVIHSGDLFETSRPSPIALLTFQKGLLKLKGAGIPMYAIAGNHDAVMRKGSIPPQVIFKKLGLKVISTINPTYMHDDIFIAGLPFFPASHGKALKSKLAELSEKATHHEKSILVLHQGIDKYFGYNYELEIGDIPDNFDYYAMGHIHKYVNDKFGKGRLVYPGSSEIWKTSEIPDYHENGKGFVVVDLDGSKPIIKRVKIEMPRQFIKKTIDYSSLESEILSIKEAIKDFDKKPILSLEINNVESDTKVIYEIINEELGDLALMIRPKFNLAGQDPILDDESSSDMSPEALLVKQLEKYDNTDVNILATDLYGLLSKDKTEEASELISQFYNEHYSTVTEDADEEPPEGDEQTTLEED
ncbi:DNA repair exonuclease [Methanobrevibacter sp.]|uniref:metallophosphoesterase family protein n=1 Tax=Methanobrevibacter sp. TaxID=66852 RepID=UPI0025F5DB52|nr:DNA repair exonuclease [Methanobrevibacter sp.]MBQ2666012.1 DNA repair exonuclease [Methanobrevibacter sp.]